MKCSSIINSFGLVIDIIGAILLYVYGIPPRITKGGGIGGGWGDLDPISAGKENRMYERLSKCGLILIIIGFACQLASNFF